MPARTPRMLESGAMLGKLALGPLALGLLLAGSACNLLESPPPPSFAAIVRVESDPGRPLAGAEVLYKTKLIGTSDPSGVVQFKLTGGEGQTFDLTVKCPEGHEAAKGVAVTLRKLADPKAIPEYKVSCKPSLRTVVVAVRAENGPNLPVIYKGSVRARTDASGAAHLVIPSRANQSISIKLDTAEAKDLRPESPVTTFEVKESDELYVLDQSFKVERKRVYVGRPRPSGPRPLN
jgi:hypothetical protein